MFCLYELEAESLILSYAIKMFITNVVVNWIGLFASLLECRFNFSVQNVFASLFCFLHVSIINSSLSALENARITNWQQAIARVGHFSLQAFCLTFLTLCGSKTLFPLELISTFSLLSSSSFLRLHFFPSSRPSASLAWLRPGILDSRLARATNRSGRFHL